MGKIVMHWQLSAIRVAAGVALAPVAQGRQIDPRLTGQGSNGGLTPQVAPALPIEVAPKTPAHGRTSCRARRWWAYSVRCFTSPRSCTGRRSGPRITLRRPGDDEGADSNRTLVVHADGSVSGSGN